MHLLLRSGVGLWDEHTVVFRFPVLKRAHMGERETRLVKAALNHFMYAGTLKLLRITVVL